MDRPNPRFASRSALPAAPAAWVPAQPGDRIEDIETPALIVDLDKCEGNLRRLSTALAGTGVRVRPHAKTHRCSELAALQVAFGAVGLCCHSLGEAEVMLAAGVRDLLITNEIVDPRKLRRLARLAWSNAQSVLGVCVDDPIAARLLSEACAAEQSQVDVYIEVDVGQNRGGLTDPEAIVALARQVASAPSLRLRGLHAYSGVAQHRRGVPERKNSAALAAQRADAARQALRAAGIECEMITGGGTGTFLYDARSGVYGEVQPGSYVFMDHEYQRNEQDPQAPRFDNALFVLGTFVSVSGDRATLDVGLKTVATDQGLPQVIFPGWTVRSISDEHTVVLRSDEGATPRLGDRTLLVPGHCDPTVNLHDWIVAVRGGVVEAVWPVDARGRSG